MGFSLQINKILGFIPKERRTAIFSATQTKKVEELKRMGLKNPKTVYIESKENKKNLSQYYTIVRYEDKLNFLAQFLIDHQDEKVIIFSGKIPLKNSIYQEC
jgi:ATP-dependent RNA helicase DDX55/SPB4